LFDFGSDSGNDDFIEFIFDVVDVEGV